MPKFHTWTMDWALFAAQNLSRRPKRGQPGTSEAQHLRFAMWQPAGMLHWLEDWLQAEHRGLAFERVLNDWHHQSDIATVVSMVDSRHHNFHLYSRHGYKAWLAF